MRPTCGIDWRSIGPRATLGQRGALPAGALRGRHGHPGGLGRRSRRPGEQSRGRAGDPEVCACEIRTMLLSNPFAPQVIRTRPDRAAPLDELWRATAKRLSARHLGADLHVEARGSVWMAWCRLAPPADAPPRASTCVCTRQRGSSVHSAQWQTGPLEHDLLPVSEGVPPTSRGVRGDDVARGTRSSRTLEPRRLPGPF